MKDRKIKSVKLNGKLQKDVKSIKHPEKSGGFWEILYRDGSQVYATGMVEVTYSQEAWLGCDVDWSFMKGSLDEVVAFKAEEGRVAMWLGGMYSINDKYLFDIGLMTKSKFIFYMEQTPGFVGTQYMRLYKGARSRRVHIYNIADLDSELRQWCEMRGAMAVVQARQSKAIGPTANYIQTLRYERDAAVEQAKLSTKATAEHITKRKEAETQRDKAKKEYRKARRRMEREIKKRQEMRVLLQTYRPPVGESYTFVKSNGIMYRLTHDKYGKVLKTEQEWHGKV